MKIVRYVAALAVLSTPIIAQIPGAPGCPAPGGKIPPKCMPDVKGNTIYHMPTVVLGR